MMSLFLILRKIIKYFNRPNAFISTFQLGFFNRIMAMFIPNTNSACYKPASDHESYTLTLFT